MLAPACTRGLIELWSDKSITAGASWSRDIDEALAHARVGLLLVSDHFLKSEFITNVELARALASAQKGGIAIRWVPISASLYDVSPLNDIQACWDPGRPLDCLPIAERKTAIKKICLEIVEEFGTQLQALRRTAGEPALPGAGEAGRPLPDRGRGRRGEVLDLLPGAAEGPDRIVGVKAFVASELDSGRAVPSWRAWIARSRSRAPPSSTSSSTSWATLPSAW